MRSNKFRNEYGYVEDISDAQLYVFLFGALYFAAKGIWNHFAILVSLFVVGLFLSCGIGSVIAWIVYVAMANDILRDYYLKNGWVELPVDVKLTNVYVQPTVYNNPIVQINKPNKAYNVCAYIIQGCFIIIVFLIAWNIIYNFMY